MTDTPAIEFTPFRKKIAGHDPIKFHPSASHVSPDYRDGWNNALDALDRSKRVAPGADAPQAVAWMWQHDETGRKGFVDAMPPDDLDAWKALNPRLHIVSPLYTAPVEARAAQEEGES